MYVNSFSLSRKLLAIFFILLLIPSYLSANCPCTRVNSNVNAGAPTPSTTPRPAICPATCINDREIQPRHCPECSCSTHPNGCDCEPDPVIRCGCATRCGTEPTTESVTCITLPEEIEHCDTGEYRCPDNPFTGEPGEIFTCVTAVKLIPGHGDPCSLIGVEFDPPCGNCGDVSCCCPRYPPPDSGSGHGRIPNYATCRFSSLYWPREGCLPPVTPTIGTGGGGSSDSSESESSSSVSEPPGSSSSSTISSSPSTSSVSSISSSSSSSAPPSETSSSASQGSESSISSSSSPPLTPTVRPSPTPTLQVTRRAMPTRTPTVSQPEIFLRR